MAPGFLAVASQPSAQLSLEEFHAWYDEEHIPLRLNRLASFHSGARYHAVDLDANAKADETRPGWMAMYEIDDTRTFRDESYTGLRLQRSEREKSVINRLEVLARKTGEVLGVWGEPESLEGTSDAVRGRTTGLKVGKPSEWIITHEMKIIPGDNAEGTDVDSDRKAQEWAESVAHKEGKGWIRTRLVKVLESGKTKMGVNTELGKEEESFNYFAVHGALFLGMIACNFLIQDVRIFRPTKRGESGN